MQHYSFWSGEIHGIQEVAMEQFAQEPTFTNARYALAVALATRADFRFFKSKGMVEGELLPFDWRLVTNLFVGARNSVKLFLLRRDQRLGREYNSFINSNQE